MGGHVVAYQLQAPTPTAPPTLPTGAGIASGAPAFLGRGLVTPFRRVANDFANDTGIALLESCVAQVLGTTGDSPKGRGELPWRTEFGSVLERLRHMGQNQALTAFAQAYTDDALKRWEPRVRRSRVTILPNPGDQRALSVRCEFEPITANVSGNNVVIQTGQATVALGP